MEDCMKNVLLLIHADDGQEARLQAALDLTRALSGHLTCLDVAELPVAIAGDYLSYEGQAMVMDIERERETKNRLEIEGRLAHEGVSWTWVNTISTLGDALLDSAALADLIVLNRKLDGARAPNMVEVTSRVLMHTRKPVVAVPEDVRRFDLGRALIAWDGHSSCLQSLQACVPLLALAQEVELYMVREGSQQLDPREGAEYLSRHGIHPVVRIEDDAVVPIDMLIADECERWNADYIVMGAYGRGRLMELFGGVTKHMLANCRLPLVLSH
jgi:nucleotide-binding universal stress UspA family protein